MLLLAADVWPELVEVLLLAADIWPESVKVLSFVAEPESGDFAVLQAAVVSVIDRNRIRNNGKIVFFMIVLLYKYSVIQGSVCCMAILNELVFSCME